jgi:hypothetical protein
MHSNSVSPSKGAGKKTAMTPVARSKKMEAVIEAQAAGISTYSNNATM